MSDAATLAFSFAFERPLDRWARWFGIVPTRCYVRVDDQGFEAVYGPWRVATGWSNVKAIERSGPYEAWKVAGPARVSWADRGMTMAATTAGGACLSFRQPVPGIDAMGLVKHPALTIGIDRLDEFVRVVHGYLDNVPTSSGTSRPPQHLRGGWSAAGRALWNWSRRGVHGESRDVDRVSPPRHDRTSDADRQVLEDATGPMFHRCYRVVVRSPVSAAEEAMAKLQADPNVIADVAFAPFTKVRGRSGEMRVGDRYVIDIFGPWKGAIEAIDVSARSLRLATLEGHMESGVIEMRVSNTPDGDTEFTIESWARSHDRFLDLLYDKVGLAKALQSEMWSIACDRFVELVDGEPGGPIDVLTERA